MIHASPRAHRPWIAVVGYGNELRGDDAVGMCVARTVASWELPRVEAIAVHQLAPEIASTLAHADEVIFVDAHRADGDDELRVQQIEPTACQSLAAHTIDPRALLVLSRVLYGRCPQAWLVTVPACDFAYGARLSPTTFRAMVTGLRFVRDLIRAVGMKDEG